ncbi:hypothetical protein TVAG_189030 [Trichomonas vaginalis G3]|uniref:Uncharacterized protein n=1 Tax=Trichomonas vaginalis (strain ATCC PRA-98 / G3) TaxID=412133 RepID=A2F323_TRIV3|nr:hypothetical protein TVAGG3_0762260 [Trichomonas vaginalis G3]EAY00687.1 hypothetical protein TVAG_189030 [Trichomonas vaginalis G3]KAI5513285.1 hypothetical protein TVAGG3_0762260 [Trichomonas vaginalis G3]|eukprot:XP_001313616.1 hypothetical protein [Trichomonas vaginalis G3]
MQNLSASQKAAQISRLRLEVERIRARNLLALQEIDIMDDWLYDSAELIDKFFNESDSSDSDSSSSGSSDDDSSNSEYSSNEPPEDSAYQNKKHSHKATEKTKATQPPSKNIPPKAAIKPPAFPTPQTAKIQLPIPTRPLLTPDQLKVIFSNPELMARYFTKEQIQMIQKNQQPINAKLVIPPAAAHTIPITQQKPIIVIQKGPQFPKPPPKPVPQPAPAPVNIPPRIDVIPIVVPLPQSLILPNKIENQILPPDSSIIRRYNGVYNAIRQSQGNVEKIYSLLLKGK